MSDLEIQPDLVLPEADLEYRYSRSGGPGGQNVNKVETRVQLRFRLERCQVLTETQKAAIRAAAGRRLTSEGDLLLSCGMHRERERNRTELRARLRRLILDAIRPRKKRVATRPTAGSKRRRLEQKRIRSRRKSERRRPGNET